MKDYSISEQRKIEEAYKQMLDEAANPYPKYSYDQLSNIVRRNAWAEGRQDGESGMKDVIDTEINRANGNVLNRVGVISAPKQFSAWNGMKSTDWNPDNFKIKDHPELKGTDKTTWDASDKLAKDSLRDDYKPGHNYTYYVTKKQYDSDWNKNPKRWYYNKKPDELRGSHYFFTNQNIEGRDNFNPNFKRLTKNDVNGIPRIPQPNQIAKR